MRLQLDWYPQPEHGGFYTAQLLGYYKAEGLDVTILPLPQYGSVAQLVSTGKGRHSASAQATRSSSGIPTGCPCSPSPPPCSTIRRPSWFTRTRPIHDFKDLEGHTVAAQTGAVWLKYVTSHYNLHNVRQIPSTLSIANFLADPDYVQQIFITSEPFFAQQAGAEVRTILISSSGYDPYRVQFTTRAFAAQHPDIVAKFVRASIRGWNQYLRDPAATNAMLLKLNPALNPAQEAYTAQTLRDGGFVTGGDPTAAQTGRMTDARWTAGYEQLKSLNILEGPLDPATAYALQFAQ